MIPNSPNPHNKFTKEQITRDFSKIFTVENVISNELANEIIEYGRQNITSATNKHNHNFSIKVDTCWLPLNHAVHSALQDAWFQAIEFFKFDITFIEPYEIKRYPLGGHYTRHIDNYHGLNIPDDRKLSMSLQLSEDSDYEGGDLVIMYKKAPRKRLSMTFFPSFYPHGVEPVFKGERWVMIGWGWGPYWR